MAIPKRKQPEENEKVSSSDPVKGEGSSEVIENPFIENNQQAAPEPCILCIFGASGDLTMRKLIPAMFNQAVEGGLPQNFAIVGFARREMSDEDFRKKMSDGITKFSRKKPEPEQLKNFLDRLFYHQSEFGDAEGYKSLNTALAELDKKFGTKGNRVFYLSVQANSFTQIVGLLKENGHIYGMDEKERFSRVIVEKPFGHNLESAESLQKDLTAHLDEEQIYRIDHYLGKETVQNLLVFRFSNAIFESLWNSRYIDNIQITVAESIGVGTRGAFYENAGLVRDIMQNHLMQLLSLVLMEPPTSLHPRAIRDEKVKVLEALKHYSPEEIDKNVFRGQYQAGFIEGEPVKAYREEDRVDPKSNVETFAAMRLWVDNWRWAGVPIYIRAGKCLPKRSTEIIVTFKKSPNILFHTDDKNNTPNLIKFRIQPNDGIAIQFGSKVPGTASIIQPVSMDFSYQSYFGKEVPEAYERLIRDCMIGDNTLFARVDESINSWKFFDLILKHWEKHPLTEEEFYPAGTWGTQGSEFLLKSEDRGWIPL